MREQSADVAIVGGGIIGLAHAWMCLRAGLKVVMFERESFAIGASVRNFGLIWPIGQRDHGLTRAMRSRAHWLDVALQAGLWIHQNGSMHLAYHEDEWNVLNEFCETEKLNYKVSLLTRNEVALKAPHVRTHHLKGGMWSATECTVNPREAVRRIPLWLEERFGLIRRFGSVLSRIEMPYVYGANEKWKVDHVFVCSGVDFETLYPEVFRQQEMYKCKLQMMKGVVKSKLQAGPSLCAGPTLRHYDAFRNCSSLAAVAERYDREMPWLHRHGIHVLLSENNAGELIIGDSHHYGNTLEPFDSEEVNRMILDFLRSFVELDELQITERWNGYYPKTNDGELIIVNPEPNVTIVNGFGGAGMTLSFGVAEEVVNGVLYNQAIKQM